MTNEFNFSELNFEIKIVTPSGTEVSINPIAQVSINETDIKKEIQLLPAQYAFFGSVYIHSKKLRDLKELELRNLKNAAGKAIREESVKAGKEFKNKEVEEIISEMDSIQKLEIELIKLDAETSQLYYLCNALDKKVTSLRSLSYMKSKEDDVDNYRSKSGIFNSDAVDKPSINPNRWENSSVNLQDNQPK